MKLWTIATSLEVQCFDWQSMCPQLFLRNFCEWVSLELRDLKKEVRKCNIQLGAFSNASYFVMEESENSICFMTTTPPWSYLTVPPGRWRRGGCLPARRSAPPSAGPGSALWLVPEHTGHTQEIFHTFYFDFVWLSLLTETNLAKLLCVGSGEQWVEYNNGLIQIPEKNALKRAEKDHYKSIIKLSILAIMISLFYKMIIIIS